MGFGCSTRSLDGCWISFRLGVWRCPLKTVSRSRCILASAASISFCSRSSHGKLACAAIWDLHPVTNGRGATEAFEQLADLAPMPSRGQLVSLDLEVVSVDLDSVPLDEVLEFKQENHREHRRYMENLRTFALELSLLEEVDRARALQDRQAELQEQASDLRKRALAAWKSPKDVTGFGLGLAGAAWSVAAHNPVPAALGILGAGLKMLPSGADGSVYSYLFRASRSMP